MKSLLGKLGVILVLIGLAILINTEVLGAECAWVLWEAKKQSGSSKVTWTLQDAFPDYATCMKASEIYAKEIGEAICARGLSEKPGIMREGDEGKLRDCNREGSHLIGSKYEGLEFRYILIFDYKCFPDTIDPRK